ncbi:MAG: hypothetical protein JO100_00500 [Pseudonocardia sp.]|nr:hypothetical protein [Pseudonocardia sp.]
MSEPFDLPAAALRLLDEDLTQSVMLPPVDVVIRRAEGMNRTTVAATAAVLTVGALGGVTLVAQSVMSGAVPLPAPVALGPAPSVTAAPAAPRSTPTPTVAEVLKPGEQLVRLRPGASIPTGSRGIGDGETILPPGVQVPPADRERDESAEPGPDSGHPDSHRKDTDRMDTDHRDSNRGDADHRHDDDGAHRDNGEHGRDGDGEHARRTESDQRSRVDRVTGQPNSGDRYRDNDVDRKGEPGQGKDLPGGRGKGSSSEPGSVNEPGNETRHGKSTNDSEQSTGRASSGQSQPSSGEQITPGEQTKPRSSKNNLPTDDGQSQKSEIPPREHQPAHDPGEATGDGSADAHESDDRPHQVTPKNGDGKHQDSDQKPRSSDKSQQQGIDH